MVESLQHLFLLEAFGDGLQLLGTNNTKRRRLTYFALDNSGDLSSLIYDPIRSSGARFYDFSGDGIADHIHLSLEDGGYGDKDGWVNGVIVDPSLPGSTAIDPKLSINSLLLNVADPKNATAAALSLRTALSGRSSTANQIGYIVLDPLEATNANDYIDDLTFLKRRALTLFSTLENNDVTLADSTSFERDIPLVNGQSLVFFEVIDATLDAITSASDSRLRFLNGSISAGVAAFSSASGVRFTLSLSDTDPGLSSLISQEQSIAPILDFSAFVSGEALRGTIVMGREASHDSLISFYRVVDHRGSVLDIDGNSLLTPGIASLEDYRRAALRSSNLVDELTGLRIGDRQSSSHETSIKESTYIAPYAVTNENTFFAFAAANVDNFAHFRVLGNNLFGYEDLLGGGDKDFDDNVMGFTFSKVI